MFVFLWIVKDYVIWLRRRPERALSDYRKKKYFKLYFPIGLSSVYKK